MSKFTVNKLNQRRRLVLMPLYFVMRLWMRTLRFEVSAEDKERLRDTSRPTILLCWHNSLFMAIEVYRGFRHPKRTYGLVSASKDGAWLAAFLNLVGLRAVRGSSSRGGREALTELTAKLREGHDIAITPDGPRGPIYSFKPGASILIRRSQARVLLVGFGFDRAWRLRSWDRFILPVPFSRVRMCTRYVHPDEMPPNIAACADTLRQILTDLTAECQRRP